MPEWDENLISPEYSINPEYGLDHLFAYWKKKVFQEKGWGMRKVLKENDSKFELGYELLSNQLKKKDFNQVR